jgi:hypothetical protein
MSPAKLEANRHNATLSTGPTSPQGKAASSRNATTHGLTARASILHGEDPEDYRAFVDDYLDYYRPANSIDHAIVVEYADLQWRLRRVPVVETQAWNREIEELSSKPENAKFAQHEIMAMAFVRLVQNKVVPNLYSIAGRLQGRANRIQKHLESIRLQQPRIQQPPPQPVAPPPPQPQQQLPKPEAPAIRKNEPIRVAPTPGRNEPCPCNSGLKFKRCCLDKPQALAAAA